MITTAISLRATFTYLRLALVTGLVPKEEVIAWADRQIAQSAAPDHRIIELALSCQRSYSAIIWSLREFQGAPDYELALPLLLARAGILLAQHAGSADAIIMGLRLLNEEENLPLAIRAPISQLHAAAASSLQGDLSPAELRQWLVEVLAPYQELCPHLQGLP